MIKLQKGYSANTITTTFNERLNYYGLSGGTTGDTYHFLIQNDLTKVLTTFSVSDISLNPWRYNEFIIDETALNLVNGFYSYSGSTNSGFTNTLEVGKLLVTGTNSFNSIYD